MMKTLDKARENPKLNSKNSKASNHTPNPISSRKTTIKNLFKPSAPKNLKNNLKTWKPKTLHDFPEERIETKCTLHQFTTLGSSSSKFPLHTSCYIHYNVHNVEYMRLLGIHCMNK